VITRVDDAQPFIRSASPWRFRERCRDRQRRNALTMHETLLRDDSVPIAQSAQVIASLLSKR
jgi:hypothetical protein